MKATEETAGLAESNGSLLPGLRRDSLHVTSWVGLTHGLGRVESRFFSFWWVGLDWVHYSKSTKSLNGSF